MPPVDVYVDVLFLINWGMDALCLILAARLLHRKLSFFRLMLASALGGIYGVLALFWEVGSMLALAADVAVCFAMCGIAMGRVRLWLSGGIYVLTSMVMGGVMTALYHWLNRVGIAELLPEGEESISSVAFVILAIASGLFTLVWGKVFRQSESRRAARLTVTLTLFDQRVVLEGMVDSGNLMADPISGTPVIAVRKERLWPCFSPELQALCQNGLSYVEDITLMPEASRLCVIPIDTASGTGMLLAVRPQEVILGTVEAGKKETKVSALVAPIPLEGAEAEALVPSCLLC